MSSIGHFNWLSTKCSFRDFIWVKWKIKRENEDVWLIWIYNKEKIKVKLQLALMIETTNDEIEWF